MVEDRNFRATLVGYLPRPISRSMVAGNRFRIILRDCCTEIGERVATVLEIAASLKLPNFYGLQRFGTKDPITHVVGRAIVRRRFDDAVRTLLSNPRSLDNGMTREARRLMSEGKYREGYKLMPGTQDIERMVAHHLARRPDDMVGSMRAAPITVRRLYVQAFQSYLFNRTLSSALRKGIDISHFEEGDNWGELSSDGLNIAKVHGVKEPITKSGMPLIQLAGYAYRNYGSRFDACLEEMMAEEHVKPRDFFVQEMQEVSVEGGFRRPHLAVSGASSDASGGTAKLEFTLPRGGYATVLLREILKPSDPFGSGFA
jgi:tRNA pseudouridine13 synthase